jgi:nucleoside 2-deoxyribosyltransferase
MNLSVKLCKTFDVDITRRWWQRYMSDKPDFLNLSNDEFYIHPQVNMIRELDFNAVHEADVVIILTENEYKLTGAMIEAGYALALRKIVIIYGKAKRSTMLSSCIHIESEKQLFDVISQMLC